MNKLMITTDVAPYPIYVGHQIIHQLKPYLENASKIVVITDETVKELHLETLKQVVSKIDCLYPILPGECSKSLNVYSDIQTTLIQHQIDRYSVILAFGGGVVGDLAGFVASTYMRGIPFIQLPTTLLAHDSAIGGKVAINHELGKNLIGSFYHPKAVIYELSFLKTLSDKEWRSGLAEMVKHGYIYDKNLLADLLAIQTISEMFNHGMQDLLIRSLAVKQHFVEADPYESGVRAFLNFGHTLAHALELVHPSLSHGEAVGIGIAFALYLSEQRFNVSLDLASYLDYLNAHEFPMPLRYDKMDVYLMYMKHDKKNKNDDIRFVLLKQVGEPLKVSLSASEVASSLIEFIQVLTDWRERRCL